MVVSRRARREYTEKTLKDVYDIKVGVVGPKVGDAKEVKILGRIISFGHRGISYEPDPGHMEAVIHELDLSSAKGAPTPGIKEPTHVGAAELLERRKC